ncbi:type IV pilus biogenesis protein PilM [Peribacillus sp. SCS-26]|uniref:type IV pilus biogenesis protein PilM n=1 Tax=Paraperibacillus marinus TaxID=3115295 RepID=UPI0039066825
MGLSFFSHNNKIVNLVIQDHAIRYVELKQAVPMTVQRWGEYLLPPGLIKDGRILDRDTLSTILEQCVSEWKIKKRQVRIFVPDPFIVVRKIDVPADVEDDEIKGYLYMELGSSIHLPYDEPVFDTAVIGEKDGRKEILLFAAPEDVVGEYSSLMEACGLVPIAADVSALSLYRLYHALDKSRDHERLLMVELDVGCMTVSIFEENRPIFMRHIQLTGSLSFWETSLDGGGSQKLVYDKDPAELEEAVEDIAKELERIMNFYRYTLHQGQHSVTRILLAGDNPFIPEAFEVMVTRFGLFVDKIDPETILTANQAPMPQSYYAALGLALKEV